MFNCWIRFAPGSPAWRIATTQRTPRACRYVIDTDYEHCPHHKRPTVLVLPVGEVPVGEPERSER